MTDQLFVTLNDGHRLPQLGLGVWQVSDAEATQVVSNAFAAGYRAVDSAAMYANEAGVGRAVRESDLPRDQLYVTTKLSRNDQGYDTALQAFDASMRKLGLETLDLYLIHWPVPQKGQYVENWRALVRLQKEGRVRSIGVSNFTVTHLQRLIDETGVVPAVNQIELHPRLQQQDLRAFHAKHGILTESWSPLGQGQVLAEPVLAEIGGKHNRSPAQIVIRWHLQSGQIVIPKTVTPARMQENFAVFDFNLDEADMAAIAGLDQGTAGRIGPDPEVFG